MPSNLPEHALVTLLKQCYISPVCQASRFGSRRLPNSSTRALHTARSTTRPRHRRTVGLGNKQKCSYSSIGSADELQSRSQANAASLNFDVDSKSSLLFAGQHDGHAGEQKETRIAIIGGGITGLTAAHYITRELPNAKVTIYEAGNKLGGWLQSEYVDVADGKVLFEKGPRTLRPNTEASLVTLDMIQNLGLKDEMLVSWNSSPAARNRFIYYPDHLVRMPGPGQKISDMLWTVMTEPVFKGAFMSLFEYKRPGRPKEMEDESVASFISRRAGGPHIANNLISAVFHGIYAGDIDKLSARSLLAKPWHFEGVAGSIGEGFFDARKNGYNWVATRDYELRNELGPKVQEIGKDLISASVFSFKEGIGAFPTALEKSLRANPNVHFRTNDRITSLEYDIESNGIKITNASNHTTANYTRAISTISGSHLSTLASDKIPSLSSTPSVTVMVVNLYYSDATILSEQGFGYLIPRSIPYDQNPECALGVVFDSDAIQGQDTVPGTKVTVMMGGHWWDGFDAYPDEEEGAAMAISVLKRHLKIDAPPTVTRVSLAKNCIPQYTVGHESRMKKGHEEVKEVFKGKLAVAGNSFTGVGMNDCVRAARDVVLQIKKGESPTGLEGFLGQQWRKVQVPTRAEMMRKIKERVEREGRMKNNNRP
ncbi:related to HEM14-protoporphyrinogen oxidase, mitochondrial [Phialocephala subalpina]|uniref:Protoporphyrinogen oxidase n=1 Tax=Phialocephala subalpina TaxID=576137 RepID=A0A1L7WCE8_9HELO|nr:related to HEM14-protoporphyrinogen oxidase, mitochondrial [Phialocephala subalpina]